MKSPLSNTKIEYIKEFLLSKELIWKGKIRDPWKMMYRYATIEDFSNNKMVRLVVTRPNKDNEFIQRIIVSDTLFKIENLKLKKMDCFENFSDKWIEFLNSKTTEVCLNEAPNNQM